METPRQTRDRQQRDKQALDIFADHIPKLHSIGPMLYQLGEEHRKMLDAAASRRAVEQKRKDLFSKKNRQRNRGRR